MHQFSRILLASLFVAFVLAGKTCIAEVPDTDRPSLEKPNIVVILADDLGYGDVQPNQPGSKIETPSFNRLAKEGVNFIDAHSGSGVCTPTRYGLVCGRYCWRTSLKRGVLGGYSKPLIAKEQQTIGAVLKQQGYYTKCVGKWHLGLGWQWKESAPKDINNFGVAGGKPMVDFTKSLTDGPLQHGFDESYIIPASLDMSPYVYLDNERVTKIPTETINGRKFPAFYRKGEISDDFQHVDCLDHLAEQACEFISRRQKTGKPFFLYFPMPAPHKPVIPKKEFEGTSGLGSYGDFIKQVDATVGKVLQTIDDAGIAENTLVIVTSDNGSFMHRLNEGDRDHTDEASIQGYRTENHRPNGILRGTKADVWEAGHRVPFFVRWPQRIKGGRKADNTICLTDILATTSRAAGGTFDRSQSPDSFSFLHHATLEETAEPQRPMVINHSSGGMFAIRDGKWKLILGNGSGGREKPRGRPFEKPFGLYDLKSDLGETKNLSDQHPEKVELMMKAFQEIAPKEMPEGAQVRKPAKR